MRRWLVHAVALALLLPALAGLLPQPALSAAAALERDIMLSVCGQDLPQQGGGEHNSPHDHCVLCTNHGPSCSPSLTSPVAAFTAAPRRWVTPQAATADAIAPPLQALLDASPPRGPPAAI